MYAALSFAEISFYSVTWVSAILYSVYQLWLATNIINPNKNKDFEIGWSILSDEKDGTDYEWQVWIPFLLFKVPWLVSHFVGAELVRRNNIELLPVWYILISSIFLLNFVGALTTVTIFLQLALIYICLFIRSKLILWIVCGILLVFHNSGDIMDLLPLGRNEQYLMTVCSCWLLLRSLSFCLDELASPSGHPFAVNFVLYLGYCLYLPVLTLGPIIIYSDFQIGLRQPYKKWTFTRIVYALCSILRYVFWGLVIDMILHYIYFNALVTIPQQVTRLGNWALYGYGYCLGQFFMAKYLVIYGIGSAVARLEQIDAPHQPRCIARVHLYSYMWRHFDRGLYLFLWKYIYLPCRGKSNSYRLKLFASFMCFVFIYIWHMTYLAIFIWTVLNFVGVTLEGIGREIAAVPLYRKWEDSVFSPRSIRRFHALIATPIFMMAALSNFYFLASYSIGNIFISRILNDSFQYNMYLFGFCYCCCQVSIEVTNWEKRRTLAAKQKSH